MVPELYIAIALFCQSFKGNTYVPADPASVTVDSQKEVRLCQLELVKCVIDDKQVASSYTRALGQCMLQKFSPEGKK
jgi:hypothetical protein